MATPKKKRETSPATWGIAVVALIAVIVVGWWLFDRRAHAGEFNRIVQTYVNEGKFEDAATALEKLIASSPPEDIAKQARTELARCYMHQGDKDELSMKKRAVWFKKAQSLDASVLGPHQIQEIELASKSLVDD